MRIKEKLSLYTLGKLGWFFTLYRGKNTGALGKILFRFRRFVLTGSGIAFKSAYSYEFSTFFIKRSVGSIVADEQLSH